MATWMEFEAAAPDLASAGQALLYQFGPGLAFLATVRRDGGPRLHPICPIVVEGGLYAMITDSPKRADLLRDGRYALHTFPPKDVDDEFSVSGRARFVPDADRHAAVLAALRALGVASEESDLLFEFEIDRAFHAAYKPRAAGWQPPTHRTWRAPTAPG